MTHEQFEKAAQYWERKEQTAMPQEALKKRLPTPLPKTTPALWPLAPAITSAAPPIEYSFHAVRVPPERRLEKVLYGLS